LSLTRNYLQYLACLKLGVNTKFVLGNLVQTNEQILIPVLENAFSKHRHSGPMLSISRNVRLCVCPSVCLSVYSLLSYRLTVFMPPFPEVGCPIFLEIRNHWEKVMERSGLRYEHFCLKIV
jgi:hypothetical protein